MRIAKIVSGGQTGADRAALDVARERGLAYGGWCPAGGWAEDHPRPPGLLAAYPCLRETPSADPAERTRRNVRDSDATLVVARTGARSPGTDLTIETAARLGRPCLVTTDADAALMWLSSLGDELTVNVAGPRASEDPGISATTRSLLAGILRGGAGGGG